MTFITIFPVALAGAESSSKEADEGSAAASACIGCSHPQHPAYACRSAALFIKGRCGCDSMYGDLPKKWRGGDAA